MNSNNNNGITKLCRNGQTDDSNACRNRVADSNEHGLCGVCEMQRRQDALDEIFARHNMSATSSTIHVVIGQAGTIAGGGASGAMNLRVHSDDEDSDAGVEWCMRCDREIRSEEQTYLEDGCRIVCSDCDRGNAVPVDRPQQAIVATATVVQPAVEAVAVQAVTPTAPQHDDCCCCLGNDATAWTKMACGHEVCTPCHTGLLNSSVTSETSRDAMILGSAGCQRDVICPLCRAQNQSTDPVELHQRLARYRKKVTDMTESNRRSCDEIRRMARVECDATRRASDAEVKRLRDIANAKDIEIATLKRQLAEATRRPAKACDGCSKPQEDDRVPYCNGCMSALYGENWAQDNGLVPPAQKVGGGGGRAEARPDERVVVIPRHQPATTVTLAEAMAIERRAGMGGARAVLGGGGGGASATPRRPCRTPNCETAKPTQRRCPGNGCQRNHRDTPCCKRCDTCPQCKV